MHSEPRVLLDATAIPVHRGGVGRYVDNLAAALDADGAALSIVCRAVDADGFSRSAPHSRVVVAPSEIANRAARLAWEQATLPRLARRLGVQVIHSPHYTMPLAGGLPSVVTVHDATFFTDRALHLATKSRFFRAWTRISLRRAAVCMVPSHATARELVRVAHARPSRLRVAHLGVDPVAFHPPTTEAMGRLRRRLKLGDRPWVAFLGTLEPRKNAPALIGAFVDAMLREEAGTGAARAAGIGAGPVLVLAGDPGWDPAVAEALAAVPDTVTVIRAGHLDIDLLPALLGGSLVTVYPSLGEGFGLPVLEAMACGAAVLTTRRLALPEVGGDAVAYTEPDRASLAAALTGLLADVERRSALRRAGVRRAAEFSWRRCAREHRRAYAAACGAGA